MFKSPCIPHQYEIHVHFHYWIFTVILFKCAEAFSNQIFLFCLPRALEIYCLTKYSTFNIWYPITITLRRATWSPAWRRWTDAPCRQHQLCQLTLHNAPHLRAGCRAHNAPYLKLISIVLVCRRLRMCRMPCAACPMLDLLTPSPSRDPRRSPSLHWQPLPNIPIVWWVWSAARPRPPGARKIK